MSFSGQSLEKKLSDMTSSQQSVQTLSLWLIHYRKHAKAAVGIWKKELEKAHSSRKLTFLYLANDVLQNGKKKGPEYNKEFRSVLPDALASVFEVADAKMRRSLDRILQIWKERAVFDHSFVESLQMPGGKDGETDEREVAEPKKKKRKESDTTVASVPAPESEELIRHLKELENAVSDDDSLRMKIASLPEEVQDVSHLDSIDSQAVAEALLEKVEDASSMLKSYNARLDTELQQREKVINLLQSYITAQQAEHEKVQAMQDEHRQRLNRVVDVQQQLRNHLANLPDIDRLQQQYSGGLAPLPSAQDLFS